MTPQALALLVTALFALPLLAIALVAFLLVSRRLARGGSHRASRWARIGAVALALHALGPVGTRYVADFLMTTATEVRAYASLLTLINVISTAALLLALAAPLVAMLADRAVLPNPSLERP